MGALCVRWVAALEEHAPSELALGGDPNLHACMGGDDSTPLHDPFPMDIGGALPSPSTQHVPSRRGSHRRLSRGSQGTSLGAQGGPAGVGGGLGPPMSPWQLGCARAQEASQGWQAAQARHRELEGAVSGSAELALSWLRTLELLAAGHHAGAQGWIRQQGTAPSSVDMLAVGVELLERLAPHLGAAIMAAEPQVPSLCT